MSAPPALNHLYLVHDEDNAANLTPALDPHFAPRRVALAFDPSRAALAEAMAGVLRGYGLRVDLWRLDDDHDAQGARARLAAHLDAAGAGEAGVGEAGAGASWALNIAGGSRPVCAAAQMLFRDRGLPIFYADAQRDRVSWISTPHAPSPPPAPLANRVTLKPFFESYLGEVRALTPLRAQVARDRLALCDELAAHPARYERALRALNFLASSARGALVSEPLSRAQLDDEVLMGLLQRIERDGFARRHHGALRFASEADRFFLNGGWLEELVHECLREVRALKPSIQDCARSVEVLWRRGGQEVMNELDVAFLANNQLFLVECKTKTFEHAARPGREADGAAEVLYKLDALQEMLGGVRCHALFVSYHDLRWADLQRARSMRVSVCAGEGLRRLRQALLTWVPAPNDPAPPR